MSKRVGGVLGDMLAERELNVQDVYEYCRLKGYRGSYRSLCRYVESCDRSYGSRYVWDMIDEVLEKSEVWWNGELDASEVQTVVIHSAAMRTPLEHKRIRKISLALLGIEDYRVRNMKVVKPKEGDWYENADRKFVR